jgi:hypothetical protein
MDFVVLTLTSVRFMVVTPRGTATAFVTVVVVTGLKQ